MPGLGDSVTLREHEVIFGPQRKQIGARRQRVNAVPEPATAAERGSAFPTDCFQRVTQIVDDALEQTLRREGGRQQSFDVFHHEYGRPVIRDDLQVLHVQGLLAVAVRIVRVDTLVSGAPRY